MVYISWNVAQGSSLDARRAGKKLANNAKPVEIPSAQRNKIGMGKTGTPASSGPSVIASKVPRR
jgi:hypothetical protein